MAGGGRPPAKSSKDGKKGGMVGNLLFFAFLIGVGVVLVVMFMKPSDHPVLSKQSDPEGAAKAYFETAYGFQTGQGNFENMRLAVRKQDYEWFQDNYMTMFQDSSFNSIVGVTSAADPSQVGALARLSAMKEITSYGPNRLDSEVLSKTVDGNSAELVVRKMDSYGGGAVVYTDCKVRLTKEGKYWKVVDFAGGRAALENRSQPGDFVSVDPSTVSRPAAQDTATPPPAATDPAFAAAGMPPEAMDPALAAENAAMGMQPAYNPPPTAPAIVVPAVTIKAPPKSPFPGGYAAPPATILSQMPSASDGDLLIGQASVSWQQRDFQASLDAAEKALLIYQHHYGPRHNKCEQVRQMVTMAQQQIERAKQMANGQSSQSVGF